MQNIEVSSAGGVDVFTLAHGVRVPKLALFDMDSTIVAAETLDEMAVKAGVGEEVKAITRDAMVRGADFDTALRERLLMLKGASADWLCEEVYGEMRLNAGAEELIGTLIENDVKCVLVSGGFEYFTSRIAKRLGMDAHHGNVLEIDGDGCLTGSVVNDETIVNGERKARFLEHYADKWGADLSECFAMGDGANDLPMMTLAGLGIGFRPAKGGKVEQEMDNIIRYGDLSTALYAMGLKG